MQFGTRRVLVRFQYDFVHVWKVTEFQYFGSKNILNILNGKALRNGKNSLGFQINNEISWISCWVLSLFCPLKFGWNVHFFYSKNFTNIHINWAVGMNFNFWFSGQHQFKKQTTKHANDWIDFTFIFILNSYIVDFFFVYFYFNFNYKFCVNVCCWMCWIHTSS